MKKENVVSLFLGVAGALLFGIGMCMCLLPEWNAFHQGVATGGGGVAVFAILWVVRRRMQHRPVFVCSAKGIGMVALGVLGALMLGIGMCMTMRWAGWLLPGIAVGCAGILLLTLLIPLGKGQREKARTGGGIPPESAGGEQGKHGRPQ